MARSCDDLLEGHRATSTSGPGVAFDVRDDLLRDLRLGRLGAEDADAARLLARDLEISSRTFAWKAISSSSNLSWTSHRGSVARTQRARAPSRIEIEKQRQSGLMSGSEGVDDADDVHRDPASAPW